MPSTSCCCMFVRGSFAAVLLAVASCLPAGSVTAQPLQWSPQRQARPVQSLEQLAAQPIQQMGYQAPPLLPAVDQTRQMQQAILIRNPDTSDGTPEFALTDQFGQIQRFVESSRGIDLTPYVGERVAVRSDTGNTLLASQLQLPTLGTAQQFPVMQVNHQQPAGNATLHTAQVAPVVIDSSGGISTGTQSTIVGPVMGNPINPYDACQTCGPYYSMTGQTNGPSCCRGSRGRVYGSAEWLLWWIDGMHTPPLVTTGDTGALGDANTQILFGNGQIVDGRRDGLRFTLGAWLNDYYDLGLEGDVFFFESGTASFSRPTADSPLLARPYFNLNTLTQDAVLIAEPGVREGSIAVNARSEFEGAGIRLRGAVCCKDTGSGCNPCGGWAPVSVSRIDAIAGYRYLSLDERIQIRDAYNSLLTVDSGNSEDRFDTSNEFHGGDLGFNWEMESQKWTLALLTKVAIGNTHQRVNIAGQTTTTATGTVEGGLLARTSNIGNRSRNVFTAVPEIGATLGYKITPRLRTTVGYTLLYWSNVARPGDHIDLDLDVATDQRPQFEWDDTSLLAHGLNLGLDYRY